MLKFRQKLYLQQLPLATILLFGISNGLVYLPEISINLGFSSFLANFTTSLKIIKNNEMPCSIFGSNHWFIAHRLLPKTVTSKFAVLVNRLQHQFGIDMQFQSSFSIFFGLSLGFKRPKLYNAATAALDTMVFFKSKQYTYQGSTLPMLQTTKNKAIK